jgi:hypothetical protein
MTDSNRKESRHKIKALLAQLGGPHMLSASGSVPFGKRSPTESASASPYLKLAGENSAVGTIPASEVRGPLLQTTPGSNRIQFSVTRSRWQEPLADGPASILGVNSVHVPLPGKTAPAVLQPSGRNLNSRHQSRSFESGRR